MHRRNITAPICMLFFVCTLAATCDQNRQKNVRTAVDVGKSIAAEELVHCYDQAEQLLKGPTAVDAACKHLIGQHEVDIKAGVYTKDDLHADCLPIIKAKLEKLNQSVESIGSSLRILEHSLDAWESLDNGKKLSMVGDLLRALRDLEELLEAVGVPVPKEISDYIVVIEGLANALKELEGEL